MQGTSEHGSISRIILLTEEVMVPHLAALLHPHNARLEIVAATDLARLQGACTGPLAGTRLLSFCSPVIVPATLLQCLPGPSYNFHPGPPERPGRYPSVFALYEEAAHFGVTVHEMEASVDSGPIVAAEWFPIPHGADLQELEDLTFMQLFAVFRRLSFHLATIPTPLRRQMVAWRGRKTCKADCDELCAITPGMDPREADRRRRACGVHMLRRD
jgi:hypothetical protein